MKRENEPPEDGHPEPFSPKRWAATLGAAWVRGVLARPWTAILAMAALTLLAAAGLPRLTLRLDGHALIPPTDPAVPLDAEAREAFGIRDPLLVVFETAHPDGIYNPKTLAKVRHASTALAAFPEIGPEQVTSLSTERRDRVYPGTLRFRPFLDPFPDTPKLLALLEEDVDAAGILAGTLVANDASAVAVVVGVPRGTGPRGVDVPELYRRVEALVEPMRDESHAIHVVGAPAAEALLGEHIVEDLAVLLPLTIALMAGILAWRLRRLWGVVLGLAEVAGVLLFTFGVMGWLGWPVYLTTAVLPVVLITLGLADEIHVFSHHQRRLADGDRQAPEAAPTPRVEGTLRDMLPPVFLTSVTTSVGFLSFSASEIEPVRSFGLAAAIGIVFCFLWTVTVVPAALTLLPARALALPAGRAKRIGEPPRWLRPFRRAPRLGLAVLAAVTLLLAAGAPRLVVQDSWIDGFARGSEFRRSTDRVNALFHGTHVLLVPLRAHGRPGEEPPTTDGKTGFFLDPERLAAVGRFESFLAAREGVGGVLGPDAHLSAVAHLWQGRQEGTRRVPDELLLVGRVVRFFDVVRGKHRRREVLDDSLDRALVTVYLKDANYRDTRRLLDDIEAYGEENLAPLGIELAFAGDVALSQAMIPSIVRSQVRSLLLALAGTALALLVLLRSLSGALLTLVPPAVSVLWTFGGMGWAGIPLGVATSMFCAIAIGVGVDYAIHYLAGVRRARARAAERGEAPDGAATAWEAGAETGPAITTDLLAIAGSFSLLAVSQVPANARLGLLVALALTAACVLTLGGLGSWLACRRPRLQPSTRPGPDQPPKTSLSMEL